MLAEFFSEIEAKERVKAFFDDFATADAYQGALRAGIDVEGERLPDDAPGGIG